MGQITMDTSEYDVLQESKKKSEDQVKDLQTAAKTIETLREEKDNLLASNGMQVVKTITHIHKRQRPWEINIDARLAVSEVYQRVRHSGERSAASWLNSHVASQLEHAVFNQPDQFGDETSYEREVMTGFDDIKAQIRKEEIAKIGKDVQDILDREEALNEKEESQEILEREVEVYKNAQIELEERIEELEQMLEYSNKEGHNSEERYRDMGTRAYDLKAVVLDWRKNLLEVANAARGFAFTNRKNTIAKLLTLSTEKVAEWDKSELDRKNKEHIKAEIERKVREEKETQTS
jgi:hypothetical protein